MATRSTPRDRSRQKVKKSQGFQSKTYKWTLREKSQLLDAIRRFDLDTEMEQIQREVPTKTRVEIEAYAERLQMELAKDRTTQSPIEKWLELSKDLVNSCCKTDYSLLLGTVMSQIASSCQPPSATQTSDAHPKPDYQAIYKYLSCLLKGGNPPRLGELECAIMMDLMHGLTDVLRYRDTSEQHQIMQWKYQLLNSRVDIYNRPQGRERCRRAMQNDFSDFVEPIEAAGTASTSADRSESWCQTPVERPTWDSSSVAMETTDEPVDTVVGPSPETSVCLETSVRPAMVKETTTATSAEGSSSVTAEKSVSENSGPPVTVEQPVIAQSGVSVAAELCSTESDIQTGKDSLTASKHSAVTATNSSSVVTDPKRQTQKNAADKSSKVQSRVGRRKGMSVGQNDQNPEPLPKKPKLYTLNPLCIPVSLLKLSKEKDDD